MAVFMSMTFNSQNHLLVTTNASMTKRAQTLSQIITILGPFCRKEEDPNNFTTILTHSNAVFGSITEEEYRLDLGAKMCILFKQLYILGWKTTCKGSSVIFDHLKRRGAIFFILSDEPVDSNFACVKLNSKTYSNHKMCISLIFPKSIDISIEMRRSLNEIGIKLGSEQDRQKEYRHSHADEDLIGTRTFLEGNQSHMFGDPYGSKEMEALLKIIDAFHHKDFYLESSVNIFGPLDRSFLFFGYKTRPESLSVANTWAFTLTKPRKVVLVNAPSEVSHLVTQETKDWEYSSYQTYWGREHNYNIGKMALSSLLSKLGSNKHYCTGSVDGLYKNTYFIFQKDSNVSYESHNPAILSCSLVSEKKLQFNSSINQNSELIKCLSKLDSSRLPMRVHRYSQLGSRVRVFEHSTFSNSSINQIARQMSILLLMMIEMNKINYQLYATGNVSGRFDKDDERYISPHTLFFVKRPAGQNPTSNGFYSQNVPTSIEDMNRLGLRSGMELPNGMRVPNESNQLIVRLPPSFSEVFHNQDDGLPTYEEATNQK